MLYIQILFYVAASNFGQDWEVSHIKTKTPYKAGEKQEIDAYIGLRVGLRSFNVTLKGKFLSGKY